MIFSSARKILSWISYPLYQTSYVLQYEYYRRNAVKIARQKKQLNVVFMIIEAGMWKLDSLYDAMLQDPQFNPILCVIPQNPSSGEEHVSDNMKAIQHLLDSKNYEYIVCYNAAQNDYLDINSLEPDIILYLNPYDSRFDDRYLYSNFKDKLTCYIDYSFCITNEPFNYNEPIQSRAWKNFVPTTLHKQLTKKYAGSERNVVVTGYPVYDMFERAKKKHKTYGAGKKVVVWAPHQSIFPNREVRWSTFLLYSDLMVTIAKQHSNDLYFIFRPHPELKKNLYQHPKWGKERTDSYYHQWETMPNAEISLDDYVEQFCGSDALIHDGGGFLAEYLYTHNPSLYLSNYIDEYIQEGRFNDLGVAAWQASYHAYTEQDIISFIEGVVLQGNDPKNEERESVFKKYALPPNGRSVAENIINEIKKSIWR